MQGLDIVAEIDHAGTLSKSGRAKMRAHLRARAVNAGLEGGDTLALRFRVNERVRSGAQHRLYFAMVGEVVRALDEAGYTAEQQKQRLHAYYKDTYLELVAAEALRETGEECDIGGLVELPNGKVIRTLTTTRLSVPAYSLFIERVASDERVTVASGADLSEILGETRALLEAGKITSGHIYETSAEATMDFGAPQPLTTSGGGGGATAQDGPESAPGRARRAPVRDNVSQPPTMDEAEAPRTLADLYDHPLAQP